MSPRDKAEAQPETIFLQQLVAVFPQKAPHEFPARAWPAAGVTGRRTAKIRSWILPPSPVHITVRTMRATQKRKSQRTE